MGIEAGVPQGTGLTTIEDVAGWMRRSSMWPLTMGLACCAIEMMALGTSRHDPGRWGSEVFRASPRQADLMFVTGRVSQKMAPVLRTIYDQMPHPKWVLAIGACASTGGMFNNYAIVQGVDHILPVDVYVAGCPPRPEAWIHAIFELRDRIGHWPIGKNLDDALASQERQAANAPSLTELGGIEPVGSVAGCGHV